jgi:hypothetical protein
MTRIVCVAIGLLLLATTAKAEYVISGLGAKSCGDLANEYRRNPSIEQRLLLSLNGSIQVSVRFVAFENRSISAAPVSPSPYQHLGFLFTAMLILWPCL